MLRYREKKEVLFPKNPRFPIRISGGLSENPAAADPHSSGFPHTPAKSGMPAIHFPGANPNGCHSIRALQAADPPETAQNRLPTVFPERVAL